jgi:phage shock protein PspC (stress-responsive transcriptional regulator)/signal transduction histidine kinase
VATSVLGPLAFARREDRVIAGVAGGFADRHGLDAVVVRVALVVLTLAGGLGLVLYAVGAVLADPPATRASDPTDPTRPPGPSEGGGATAHPRDLRRDLAVGCVTVGVALLVRSTGVWLGDAVMVPVIVVGLGVGVLAVVQPALMSFAHSSGAAANAGSGSGSGSGEPAARAARLRLFLGAALVALGIATVGSRDAVSANVRVGAFAAALTILGVALVLGPWLTRLAQEAAAERRERIRATEREAMAAHLHDSVLQTLALIQRTADDPRRTVTLARQQERELRSWLYGASAPTDTTLAGLVRSMVDEVEAQYGCRVEVVVVGDLPVDDAVQELVAALREGCVNAAKHAGVDEMSVFVEVGTTEVAAFVRDRGRGFDPVVREVDRHGISGSIRGRMERIGGRAVVESTPGDGTEVQLVLPRPSDGVAAPTTAGRSG